MSTKKHKSETPLNKQTKKMVLVYSTDVNAEIEQKLRIINYDHQVDLILDSEFVAIDKCLAQR